MRSLGVLKLLVGDGNGTWLAKWWNCGTEDEKSFGLLTVSEALTITHV